MHDWILLSAVFEWDRGKVIITFKSHSGMEVLVAHSVVDLHVSQLNEWGPSVSVNEVSGPFAAGEALQSVEIEMQSGDVLSITAKSFDMPKKDK
jgi:hypothetical protein